MTRGGRKLASVTGLAGGPIDLKQYLPGGVRDPYGRVGGNCPSCQRHGQSEDLFKIITAKFSEKCKLGLLLQCSKP
jgi:hypothetical protein